MGILWNRCFFACHCNIAIPSPWGWGISPWGLGRRTIRNRHCIPKLRLTGLLSLTPRVLGTLTSYGWTISQEVSWLLRQTDYWGPGPPALNTCLDTSESEAKNSSGSGYTDIIMSLCCLEFFNNCLLRMVLQGALISCFSMYLQTQHSTLSSFFLVQPYWIIVSTYISLIHQVSWSPYFTHAVQTGLATLPSLTITPKCQYLCIFSPLLHYSIVLIIYWCLTNSPKT